MDIDMDIIEYIEVQDAALSSLKPGESIAIGQWAYYLTKTGKWLYRMLASEAKNRGFGHRDYKLGVSGSQRKKMQAAVNRRLASMKKTPKLDSFKVAFP
jgi:hypothetical protein